MKTLLEYAKLAFFVTILIAIPAVISSSLLLAPVVDLIRDHPFLAIASSLIVLFSYLFVTAIIFGRFLFNFKDDR